MQKKCTCPGGTRWLQEPPTSHNAYKVECVNCRRFIKWGTQAQLDELVDAGADGEFVPYEEPPPRANLDAFIVNDD